MNQTVFITGVSSGIGHGLASAYLARSDRVLGVSRRTPADLMDQPNFSFRSTELSDPTAVATDIPELLTGIDSLDLVILNAGILGEIADIKDTSLSQLKMLMDVNVWACKSTLDAIYSTVAHVDKVVTISSGAAVNGNRGWAGYSISKAALNMLTQLYARENEDTFFAAVAPGLVDTAMQDYLCGLDEDSRFPSLENLKSRRNTAEMPGPAQAAERLLSVFDDIQQFTSSGGFVDIRQLPDLQTRERI